MADTAKRKFKPAHQGMLYAIADSHGHIKVGFTRNLKERLRTIQVYQAQPVNLIVTWPGNMHDEALFHSAASLFRVRSEWYQDGEGIRSLIRDCAGAVL